MSISAAKSRVMQARMNLESGRTDEVEATLRAAENFLAEVPEDEAAPIRAQLAQLRSELAKIPKPEDARNLSAAQGKLRQAKSLLADRQPLLVEEALRGAERYLAEVPDAMKTKELVEFAELRAHLAGKSEPRRTVPDVPEARAATPSTPTNEDDAKNVSLAKSRILQARSLLEGRRLESVEAVLDEALGYLSTVADAGSLRAEIEAIRAETQGADRAGAKRRVQGELERHFDAAESNMGPAPHLTERALGYLSERVGAEDVKRVLSATELAEVEARITSARAKFAAATKTNALERARPLLAELEARVASDPFRGLAQHDAYVVTRELESLKLRILAEVRVIPEGDAEVAEIRTRVTSVERAIDSASMAWAKAELEAAVGNDWAAIASDLEGWEAETSVARGLALDEPDLPKTRLAVQRIRFLLEDPETQRIREENANDDAIQAPYRTAEAIFAGAATKLAAAFEAVLAAGEAMPTPLQRAVLDRPTLLVASAEAALQGTSHVDRIVSRARKLDDKWKAEVAEIMRTRQELYDRLAAEADVTWPALLARTNSIPFDPKTATVGSVVRLEGIYNRSGWDFAAQDYALSLRFDGVPVGASYEPHVRAALEHAWYELKLDVSDRIPWDVVAIVEGKGTIGVRTTVSLRDKTTNRELGKLEQWPPVDCIRLRVVALHAGPVAVGPAPKASAPLD